MKKKNKKESIAVFDLTLLRRDLIMLLKVFLGLIAAVLYVFGGLFIDLIFKTSMGIMWIFIAVGLLFMIGILLSIMKAIIDRYVIRLK